MYASILSIDIHQTFFILYKTSIIVINLNKLPEEERRNNMFLLMYLLD